MELIQPIILIVLIALFIFWGINAMLKMNEKQASYGRYWGHLNFYSRCIVKVEGKDIIIDTDNGIIQFNREDLKLNFLILGQISLVNHKTRKKYLLSLNAPAHFIEELNFNMK